MQSASSFSSSTRPLASVKRHAAGLAQGVAGLQIAEAGGIGVALSGVAAEAEGLQVAEVVGAALVPGHDVVHLQGPLMFMGSPVLAAAPGAG